MIRGYDIFCLTRHGMPKTENKRIILNVKIPTYTIAALVTIFLVLCVILGNSYMLQLFQRTVLQENFLEETTNFATETRAEMCLKTLQKMYWENLDIS